MSEPDSFYGVLYGRDWLPDASELNGFACSEISRHKPPLPDLQITSTHNFYLAGVPTSHQLSPEETRLPRRKGSMPRPASGITRSSFLPAPVDHLSEERLLATESWFQVSSLLSGALMHVIPHP